MRYSAYEETTLVVEKAYFEEHSQGNMGVVIEGLILGDQYKTLDKLVKYKISSSFIKLVGKNPFDFTYMVDDLSLIFKIEPQNQAIGPRRYLIRSK